jgi:hypothetical protein
MEERNKIIKEINNFFDRNPEATTTTVSIFGFDKVVINSSNIKEEVNNAYELSQIKKKNG